MDDAGALPRGQLGEPRYFVAVVEAIAAGSPRMIEIALLAGLAPGGAGKCLSELRQLDMGERLVPATVSRPERGKEGRCQITEHHPPLLLSLPGPGSQQSRARNDPTGLAEYPRTPVCIRGNLYL
jgi:hypothetical protein